MKLQIVIQVMGEEVLKKMRAVKPKKADVRSSVELRSYFGKRESKNRYILVKTHIRQQ